MALSLAIKILETLLNRLGIFRKLDLPVFLFWKSDDAGRKYFQNYFTKEFDIV